MLFPHDVQMEFGLKGKVNVQALLEGIPYTGALMTCGTAYHMLAVPKAIREQLGKNPGDLITVELWKDDAPRTVDVPEDFLQRLRAEELVEKFETLSRTRRKEYCNWIATAKRKETRQRRLAKAIEILKREAVPSRKRRPSAID